MTFRGFYTADVFECPPFQMFSNADDPLADYILEHRQFEPHSMRIWCRLARHASAILDVGAHVGVYSLAAAALRKDIAIHAFEPNPFTAARLRVNKHLNGFDNIVEHHVAVAEGKGIAELTWMVKPNGWLSSGSRLGPHRDGWEKAAVYARSLDMFEIDPGPLPLIKIDVEGTEHNVFRGMPVLLQARPAILIETFRQQTCDYIATLLPDYTFYLVDEAGRLSAQTTLTAAQQYDENKNRLLLPNEKPWLEFLSAP